MDGLMAVEDSKQAMLHCSIRGCLLCYIYGVQWEKYSSVRENWTMSKIATLSMGWYRWTSSTWEFAISPNWQAKLQDLDNILQTYHSEIPYRLVRSLNSSRWNYGRQLTIQIRCTIKVSQDRHVNTVNFHKVTHARGSITEHKFHASYST